MLCTEFTKIMQEGGRITAEPLRCRCWHCEHCQPKRCAQLRALALSGKPDTFLTLTVNPAVGKSPSHRAQMLAKSFRMLRQFLIRKGYAEKLPFLAVFERTKAGEPHLHILMRAPFIPQHVISAYMAKRMRAPIVDIRRIKSHGQAVGYVTKYVGKDPFVFKGCKRYWRSMDWQVEPDDYDGGPATMIAIIRRPYDAVVNDMIAGGVTSAETIKHEKIRIGWWSSDYVLHR